MRLNGYARNVSFRPIHAQNFRVLANLSELVVWRINRTTSERTREQCNEVAHKR